MSPAPAASSRGRRAGLDRRLARRDVGTRVFAMVLSEAAVLATSSPEEIARVAEAAAAQARTLIESVKTSGSDPLATFDAYDEAMAALGNTSDRVDLIANTQPDEAMRDAADAAKQALAKVRTDISLDRGLYDVLAALDLDGADAATRHY